MDQLWIDYLAARGVTKEASAARGYRQVYPGKPEKLGVPADAAAVYGFPQKAGGLLMPLHALMSEGLYQLRYPPGQEPKDSRGKARRFTTPKGQPNVLATCPLTRDLLAAPEQPIFVVEGVTRADALGSLGIPAVAITGVDAWRGQNQKGGVTSLADWEEVNIQGNRFIICPDGDVSMNPNVHKAVVRLQRFLTGKRADKVVVLVLPEGLGLDDWLARQAFPDGAAAIAGMREYLVDKPVLSDNEAQAGGHLSGRWSKNADGDAWRLLLDHGHTALLAEVPGEYAKLYLVNEYGLWKEDLNAVLEAHSKTCKSWADAALSEQRAGQMQPAEVSKVLKYLEAADGPRGAEMQAKACRAMWGQIRMVEGQEAVEGVTVCQLADLDRPGQYMAAANGVIDLQTGQLLPPDDARRRLVTHHSGTVRYSPDAYHPAVDKLFGHLGEDRREYLLRWLGRAMWGQPPRGFLIVHGEPHSGKGTLFAALRSALGGYAGFMSEDALRRPPSKHKTGPTPERQVLVESRFALGEEAAGWEIGYERLKAHAGGEPFIPYQPKYGPERTVRVQATIILSANHMPRLGLDDEATADRLGVVNYVRPDKLDPSVKKAFDSGDAAEAMLALLVKTAKANPPVSDTIAVPESVREEIRDAIAAELSEFHIWLRGAVQQCPKADGRISTGIVWQAWAAHQGKSPDLDEINGQRRAGVAGAFRKAMSAPGAKHIRVPPGSDTVARGWLGYRLADTFCSACGRVPVALDGGDRCPACAPPTVSGGRSALDYPGLLDGLTERVIRLLGEGEAAEVYHHLRARRELEARLGVPITLDRVRAVRDRLNARDAGWITVNLDAPCPLCNAQHEPGCPAVQGELSDLDGGRTGDEE